ncbi:MAG: transcription termination/antitermination protein NusA [Candidatus Yonathbacteria bacterium CG_4_10_14_3_um_filter_47_65]|uniref:Transcription termination/antitermination protein NusA n=2 Tax=Parcubacteria group TaxID=1794811 RepID=A0A2M8D7W2_9BACT|nr:MAG: hypothetical protein AUJ44_00460 [Candidatus Nomurabacteria bacterium CG1_02_47_685]PIP04245.1 MAG: transcription termination/antitermination protein NusA [Candidatus Yonathbacteria bacterium CG23_combo_of_CG06-09_8_20_14_all_46_18]PIQ31946.1 MAG: transcription termination/antitermination protein NusA [Candidatus Yonathbacteria bacterium CG17_big_fil_post_rev_8_21_14_2_50_46_19]PIX56154.1 MAG: transcription termination/antitermination protein NusA [Candidatus Yonathbacteria bacterium CG_
MIDLKVLGSALSQLEEERGIPKEKIIDAIEQALAAAYKKDYGKKGQIVRAKFDMNTGTAEFYQVKVVVDESMLKPETENEEEGEEPAETVEIENADGDENNQLVRFNSEHHILLEDAQKMKKDVEPGDELTFPLETKDDYGRIAAQTAKQVIIQRIREAEKISVMEEFGEKQEKIVTGTVQRIERGNIFVDLGKATGILPYDEQIPGERYRQGERIRAYLYSVEEGPKGINLRLSRSHPRLIACLFENEAPEVASGVVEIKEIAREAGSRTKIAVASNDEYVDPIGACVGQRGVRVSTVMSELGGEKIDIIEWSPEPEKFVEDALSPAKVISVSINEQEKKATIKVSEDQLSLAIGKGGQNVRLAAKLTGWRIDIKGTQGENILEADGENVEIEEPKNETGKAKIDKKEDGSLTGGEEKEV